MALPLMPRVHLRDGNFEQTSCQPLLHAVPIRAGRRRRVA